MVLNANSFFKKSPHGDLNLEPKYKHITIIYQSNFIPAFQEKKNSLKNKTPILHMGLVIIFHMDMLYCLTTPLFWMKNTVRFSVHFYLLLKVEKSSEMED